MADLANTLAFTAYDQEATPSIPNPVNHDVLTRESKEVNPCDRDSGVFLSDQDSLSPPSSRPTSLSLKHSPSSKSATSPQRDSSTRRLRRPAELNLGTTPDSSKPKSELELRYDLIRNSQNQSKAALRSPTELLRDRLNLSPKKEKHEIVRIFTPPKPMLNGCILPGPQAQMEAFKGWSVCGRTEKESRPTWWCKFDKVVVFDGEEEDEEGNAKFKTRTSKGLTIARRRGDTETVIIPMDCRHCQEMLNRTEWKYDVQVCKRVVCWDCNERCKWELEQQKMKAQAEHTSPKKVETRVEANRERADSVLQDEPGQDEKLMAKIGLEPLPKTPDQTVGGIDERLEYTVIC